MRFSSSDQTDAAVVSHTTDATHPSQAAAFGRGLQDHPNGLFTDPTAINERVEGLAKRLATLRTAIALTPFAGPAVLMGFGVSTEPTFHD
jgi:hypothetical protein